MPEAVVAGVQPTHLGLAELTLTIRWPARTSQGLPPNAVRVEATVRDKVGNPLGAASVNRDGAPTSTLAITDIQVPIDGLVTVNVRAIDAANEEVGMGSKMVTIVPNQRTAVAISVTATKVPGLTFVNPLAAGPGIVVRASGNYLPKSKDGVTLKLGGIPVDVLNLDASGGTFLEFIVPGNATSDQVVLGYLGQTIKSNDTFQTIKSITLAVPPSGLASGSTATFVAQALNSASEAVAGARLTWNLINVTGVPGSAPSGGGASSGGAAGVPGGAPGGGGPGSMDNNYVGSFVDFQSTSAIAGGEVAGGAPGGSSSSGGSASPPQATNSITFTTAGTATLEVKTGQTVATATIVIKP